MSCPRFDVRSNTGALYLRNDWDTGGVARPFWWSHLGTEGWFDKPLRQDRMDLAGASGELVATKKTAQVVVVSGFCGVARPEDYWAALKRIDTVIDGMISNLGTLVWHDPVAQQIRANLAPGPIGEARVGNLTDKGLEAAEDVAFGFTFSLAFIAPTPGPTTYP